MESASKCIIGVKVKAGAALPIRDAKLERGAFPTLRESLLKHYPNITELLLSGNLGFGKKARAGEKA